MDITMDPILVSSGNAVQPAANSNANASAVAGGHRRLPRPRRNGRVALNPDGTRVFGTYSLWQPDEETPVPAAPAVPWEDEL